MPEQSGATTQEVAMTLCEFDFPCGCRTDKFDPRVWHLCRQHETSEIAIFEWAAEGARLYRAILDLPPAVNVREKLDRAYSHREAMEDLPEGTLPRV